MATLVEDLAAGRELIETHISWVFLDGDQVFKVKKPVDFGFLDFHTLEQRRIACEREVELNRRLSHDVYLGVMSITLNANGQHRFGGDGDAVEFAVHMRRLQETQRLDNLLASDSAPPDALQSLAERLELFHKSSNQNADIGRFGSIQQVRANVCENFAQTRDHILDFISLAEAAELEARQLQFLEQNAQLFARRVDQGRVRDGHGDLRLEHVYLTDTGLQVLDCIEFNDRFRYADVCADIAFLTMDLRHQGYHEQAEDFLAAYAQAAGDYDLYALIDFYESYRAFVRAKVTSYLVADPQLAAHVRRRAQTQARQFFLQSLLAERPALDRPMVVAVGGLIASGKSHTSQTLSTLLHCPVVDTDRTRKQLFGGDVTVSHREPSFQGVYSRQASDQVYAEVRRRAAVVVQSGRSVVIDASFRTARERSAVQALCGDLNVRFLFVECQAPLPTIHDRLRHRATRPSISDGRAEIFEDFADQYEPVTELLPEQRCVLNTTQPSQAQTEQLSELLARSGPAAHERV